jgi:hypothetical protein
MERRGGCIRGRDGTWMACWKGGRGGCGCCGRVRGCVYEVRSGLALAKQLTSGSLLGAIASDAERRLGGLCTACDARSDMQGKWLANGVERESETLRDWTI